MTPEARLDRLEKIAKLFVRAGLRYRSEMRALNEKFNILVNAQIKNEELFARNDELFAQNEERFARNDDRFARTDDRFARDEARLVALSENTDRKFVLLAEAQRRTEESLAELIKVVRNRNGNPQPGQ